MDGKKIFKGFSSALILCLIVIVFVIGYYAGSKQNPAAPKDLTSKADFSIVWEVWNKLEQKYYGKLDYQKMVYGAAKGVAASLGDPYTVFYDPKESAAFKEDINGAFEGLGMEVAIKDNILTVVAPIQGTPAKKAGLMPGDKILKIDSKFTSDMTIDEAVSNMRGKKGTEVTLSVLRNGWEQAKDFKITRDVINIPSIKLEIIDNQIAHLTIYQFNDNLTQQMIAAAAQLLGSNAKKIVLDLRSNPGGLLDKAQETAGWFLDKGTLVLIEKYSDGTQKEYKAKGSGIFAKYPLVVLINGGTASGAEILAASLKENNSKVELIGETTFGKGLVQEAIDVDDNAMLKVTTAHWLTPKGNEINKIGLKPDIEIKISDQDLTQGKDPQLDKAIEILNAK